MIDEDKEVVLRSLNELKLVLGRGGAYEIHALRMKLREMRESKVVHHTHRYAIGFIFDVLTHTPLEKITPSHVDAIGEAFGIALKDWELGSLSSRDLDGIRKILEKAEFEFFPHPLDTPAVEETYEKVCMEFADIEKRLSAATGVPVEKLKEEIPKLLETCELNDYDHNGLPMDWLFLLTAKDEWENDFEEQKRMEKEQEMKSEP